MQSIRASAVGTNITIGCKYLTILLLLFVRFLIFDFCFFFLFNFRKSKSTHVEILLFLLAIPVHKLTLLGLTEAAGHLNIFLICLVDHFLEAVNTDEVVAVATGKDSYLVESFTVEIEEADRTTVALSSCSTDLVWHCVYLLNCIL